MKIGKLIPERRVLERYDHSAMTQWRWDNDADLNFPKAVYIRKRKFRVEEQLDEFDARMMGEVSQESD